MSCRSSSSRQSAESFAGHHPGAVRASLRDLVWAITDDRDVRGYLHGSLPGNYDWLSGYQGRCGVLGVDRVTRRHCFRPGAAAPDATARASVIA